MATTLPVPGGDDLTERARDWSTALLKREWVSWLPFFAVVGVALAANGWGISKTGYGNTYYAAAVRSMTQSWHNFFFGSFDPGGFITVDKPPVFLWVDALSARLFGYSSLSLLLPSAVAGAAAVGLLYLIVKRYFGVAAALIAALVLALTPIAVAVNRLNLPEPFYILALVGAAGASLRSLEGRRWWAWAALAGLLVGVAFNTKMLAAWIPGPAFALAIVAGVTGPLMLTWRQWLPRLAVLGAVTLLASASWMLVVDVWPASARPYIGGSTDNSVQDLILGYNGLERVEGMTGFGGGRRPAPVFVPRTPVFPGGARTNAPGGAVGAGGIIAGLPGPFRLFDAANGGQIAWFLPFALLGSLASLWFWRKQTSQRASVVLWLGWTLLFGGIFSFSKGIYHSYYTAALAPGVAALTGISVVAVAQLVRKHWGWLLLAGVMAGVSIWVQLTVSGRFDNFFGSLRPLMVLLVLAGVALTVSVFWQKRLPAFVGVTVIAAGLLLIPAAWSGYETAHASLNTTLPQAGPRVGASGRSFGSQAFDTGVSQLATWLEEHRETGTRWDIVVAGAQQGSTLIADYGLSVMAIGGFSGNDPTITPAQFAEYVARGEARYVLASGFAGVFSRGGPGAFPNRGPSARPNSTSQAAGSGSVMAAVQATCAPLSTRDMPSQYRNQVYDCAGRAAALASYR